MASRLNELKSQHIATEVKIIDDKTKKNSSDILGLEGRLKQKEDTINENERGLSFNRGFFYYLQKSKFVYECKFGSFDSADNKKISKWKSTGIFNYVIGTNMIAVKNVSGELPEKGAYNDFYVNLSGNHFKHEVQQDSNNLKINIYCVYKLDPIFRLNQLIKEKLCIGNLSDQWTTSESEKTGLYGNIYDFIVNYK